MQCKTETLRQFLHYLTYGPNRIQTKDHHKHKQQRIKSFPEDTVFAALSRKKPIQTACIRVDYETLINRFQKSY